MKCNKHLQASNFQPYSNKFKLQIVINHNQYNHVELTTECFLPADTSIILSWRKHAYGQI